VTLSRVAVSAAACVLAIVTGASPVAGADPGDPCGPDQATATDIAIAHNPRDGRSQAPWSPVPVGGGNFDSCANISALVLSIVNPKPNSPRMAFLFSHGVYVGTSTTDSRPYTTLDAAASNRDLVVLNYVSGRTCAACNDGKTTIGRVRWDGARPVVMDAMPPAQSWP
jgi:hypothetical protein